MFTKPLPTRRILARPLLERFTFILAVLGTFLGLGASTASAHQTVALRFSVPQIEGEAAVDDAWIQERMEWANTIFAPAGLAFRKGAIDTRSDHVEAHTRGDRHRFGGEVAAEVVNIFVVGVLRDIDEPERFRQGVHWRSRTHEGTHYIIISKSAGPTTLAHELGHFFGNRQHSDTPGNIMSYQRGEVPPFFDVRQLRVIRRHLRTFLRTRELVALPEGPAE